MSKHWKPGRQTVAQRPSKIRREPVRPSRIRRDPVRQEKEVQARSEEREIWLGVAGVLLIAASIAVATVGISAATIFHRAANTRPAGHFGQCYNEDGPNCVLDGDTIYVGGEKVQVAGIEVPAIQDARCDTERSRGIQAAVKMADLLSSGAVTVSPSFRDEYGRDVRTVQVKGEDVAGKMIAGDAARRYDGLNQSWCAD